MAPKNGPPDRWLDYTSMGDKIPGTRFLCMKVPLKPSLTRFMKEDEKFSCEDAMEAVNLKGYKLGLVVDLSFTKRYYDSEIFERNSIQYQKIFMPGRVIPEKSIIDNFSDAIDKFEHENSDNDNVIAVHCTHGLNRTGYMICRYLIDKNLFKPQEAIDAFEAARGHKIEREIYLNDLLGKPSKANPETGSEPDRKYRDQIEHQQWRGNGYGAPMTNTTQFSWYPGHDYPPCNDPYYPRSSRGQFGGDRNWGQHLHNPTFHPPYPDPNYGYWNTNYPSWGPNGQYYNNHRHSYSSSGSHKISSNRYSPRKNRNSAANYYDDYTQPTNFDTRYDPYARETAYHSHVGQNRY